MEKTNDLRFRTSKEIKEGIIYVSIRLNDECKNGHQDFAITGDIYSSKTSKAERYYLSGGCIHEDIIEHFPEFAPFINLHLCDYKGVPMHAVANGLYHLRSGFDSHESKSETQKEYFCFYYRVTPEQYDVLNESENQLEYAILLKELGVLDHWQEEANQAVKQLEELTGKEFVIDSKRTQYQEPEPEKVADFQTKKKAGYYTPEKKAQRAAKERHSKKLALIKKIKNSGAAEIEKIKNNRAVKLWIISHIEAIAAKPLNQDKGFNLDFTFENFIYYDHTNTIKFNWMDSPYYGNMTQIEFNMICEAMTEIDFQYLPKNISFQFGEVIMYGQK